MSAVIVRPVRRALSIDASMNGDGDYDLYRHHNVGFRMNSERMRTAVGGHGGRIPQQSAFIDHRYEEAYLGLGGLGTILRWAGLFPVFEVTEEKGGATRSPLDRLRFTWTSKWAVYELVPAAAIVAFIYFMPHEYTFRIPNAMESFMTTGFCVLLFLLSFLSLVAIVYKAAEFPIIFRRFSELDRILNIERDDQLRRYSKSLQRVAMVFIIFFFSINPMFAIFKYVVGDFSGPLMLVAVFTYTTYLTTSLILPQIFFNYFCKAVTIRIGRLSDSLRDELTSGRSDVSRQLEALRLAYKLIVDLVEQLDRIWGVVLLVVLCFDVFALSTAVYLLVKQSIANIGMNMIKIGFLLEGMVSLVSVCLSAEGMQDENKKLTHVLYFFPSTHLTSQSNDEVIFFLNLIKASSPIIFTAADYFGVDKDFILKVAGITLTYTLTILEFADKAEPIEESTISPLQTILETND